MNHEIMKQLAATAELSGAPMSVEALDMMATDLEGSKGSDIIAALKMCRASHRGRLTSEAIMSRLPGDGRLGADEAWAIAVKAMDEAETVVWTQEIASAWGVAREIMAIGDEVGARLAFRATYVREVAKAQVGRLALRWYPTLGTDPSKRTAALEAAADRLQLPHLRDAAMIADESSAKPSHVALDCLAAARSYLVECADTQEQKTRIETLIAGLPEDPKERRGAIDKLDGPTSDKIRHILGEASRKRQLDAAYALMAQQANSLTGTVTC